uniref:THAP domaincontaining protein 6like [Takifugu rubripes] n=1 Tax=Lepeophtheirus salmonis TaxID=72036 RepID=A0A0K2T0U2_LEPSM
MPHCCAVYGCHTSKKKSNEHISFHRFPKEVNERKKWRIAICRKGWKPTDSSRICSIHFKDEDYIEGLQRRVLTPGAIPSIFPSFPPHLQRVENKRRVLVRNNIQKFGLQNNETSNKGQRSSIPLIMPPYKPPPSKPITETEHNYSYPNDINILKNRCDMLKDTLERMSTQNKQFTGRVIRRDSKIKKINNKIQYWIKKNVLSIETIRNLKQYNIENRIIK